MAGQQGQQWHSQSPTIKNQQHKNRPMQLRNIRWNNLEYYKPLLKAERSTPFNDLLKLARESKQTVVGNEFHTFTTLFAKKLKTHQHKPRWKVILATADRAIWRVERWIVAALHWSMDVSTTCSSVLCQAFSRRCRNLLHQRDVK